MDKPTKEEHLSKPLQTNIKHFEVAVTFLTGYNFIVADDNTNEVIILVNNAIAFTLQEARISTSAATDIEQSKNVGVISTNMRLLKKRDGDLSAYFDISDESENGIIKSSLKQILLNKHLEVNRGVTRGHPPLNISSDFVNLSKKWAKVLVSNLN